MATALLALGAILMIEGLVIALAPQIYEDFLRWLVSLPVEARRTVGFLALTGGALLIWGAAWIGG
ncbi:DUF2065 domain-containing protein [Vannielia litorea]|uniref:DUF2065 domain-containing protein n=1 Tax=Vannielia TaxID=2813041 RepID=UPI001C987E1D|nr:DUF2065 domain-containing protein [Vannielia litorea]MBY6046447.1 DUF2065 domain-containing protein [Vannielia litorea]MBY6073860.1 DUF2065 domain-containing protein [Vannielia litorea]MBY6153644.1 DUF2065 domain-containing protein [Vannielia litorea]